MKGSSIGDRLIRDERITARKCLLAAPDKLSGQKLPLLILRVRRLSYDAINIVSDVLGGYGSPHVHALVQQ